MSLDDTSTPVLVMVVVCSLIFVAIYITKYWYEQIMKGDRLLQLYNKDIYNRVSSTRSDKNYPQHTTSIIAKQSQNRQDESVVEDNGFETDDEFDFYNIDIDVADLDGLSDVSSNVFASSD